MKIDNPITHNRLTGEVNNASTLERLGMMVMSFSSALVTPIGHVGYSLIAKTMRTLVGSKRMVVATELEDTKFAYPYGDLYWSRLAYRNDRYSPDMENFLYAIRHVDYVFLDCGANFGYFSALVTSQKYGKKPSMAIEADPETYKFLEKNSALNDNRFEIRHNAIYSKSGEVVNIYGSKHEARSIVQEDNQDALHGNVETLAINDLADWVKSKKASACMIKLDVEGVEIEAIKGATALLEDDYIIYYEDHGSDKDHIITRYIMDNLGLKIYWPDFDGKCRAVNKIEELKAIKKNPHNGYDFVATKSEMWLAEIEKLLK